MMVYSNSETGEKAKMLQFRVVPSIEDWVPKIYETIKSQGVYIVGEKGNERSVLSMNMSPELSTDSLIVYRKSVIADVEFLRLEAVAI
tara:strand:- start:129 stop:392 length:264 start_codon:yes stop_codon:yes gene_type:complete